MNIGDVVILTQVFVTVDMCDIPEARTVMIISGPNEAGNIKVLLPSGDTRWVHCSSVEYPGKQKMYLKK